MYPISDRDFIAFRETKILNDGTYVNLGHSINYSDKPIIANPVRAKGKVAIYHTPIPGNPYRCHMTKYILTDPMGGIPKFMLTVAHKQITQSVALFSSFLQKKFGEKDRPLPLQISSMELNEPQQDFVESDDDDSFCSLESYDDEEFSIVDASQEIHRIIPQTSSIPLSNIPVNTQPSGSLKHTTHVQEPPNIKSPPQQPQQQQLQQSQQQQLEKQNYQWQNQNSNTNNKTSLPQHEKVDKTGNYSESGNNSDVIITKTLLELQKNVANLQLQIDRMERMQSRNSILTHLFYFSWPIVVVVAYHIFRKKLA
jgi:hypothetical protein